MQYLPKFNALQRLVMWVFRIHIPNTMPMVVYTGSPDAFKYLDRIAAVYGVERMRKRVWWTLWIWNRRESDDALRLRCVEVVQRINLNDTGRSPWDR